MAIGLGRHYDIMTCSPNENIEQIMRIGASNQIRKRKRELGSFSVSQFDFGSNPIQTQLGVRPRKKLRPG